MSSAPAETANGGPAVLITEDGLDAIIVRLRESGHSVIGPRLDNASIVYAEISGAADLPRGSRDVQGPGAYRVEARPDGAFFGFSAGAHPWKSFLHPPVLTMWTARRDGTQVAIDSTAAEAPRLALFGVRPCDLAAIAALDRVLLYRAFADQDYRRRRERLFIVGVSCTDPASTCFCSSMGTGPELSSGYDIALTEIVGSGGSRFLVETATRAGADLMAAIPSRPAGEQDRAAAREGAARARAAMTRTLDTDGLADWLMSNPDHPNWRAIADRCLTCGNCTMVCPTCFCTTVRDVVDLAGARAERQRMWDSCFTSDFSYIHGGSVRPSALARLRHRITHKLGTWQSQFGAGGCVGCGRCTTWCPSAIDMTTEVCMMRDAVATVREADYADA